MNRNERLNKIVEAIKNSATGNLSLHVIISDVFGDHTQSIAVDRALAALNIAEARGLIRRKVIQIVGTTHDIYEAA